MKAKSLTPRQSQVLSFIVREQKKAGMPPTVREIAAWLGRSINNARQHLLLIEQKGYIRLIPGKARGIEVVVGLEQRGSGNERLVPLVGVVAAGKPITAVENLDGYVALDKNLFRGDGLFTLRTKGDSMEGIGVLDGDIVIVRQQETANNGDVVVAIIEGEATLKRYNRKSDCIVLKAENPRYNDIVVQSDKDVWIVGKMVGLMRKC